MNLLGEVVFDLSRITSEFTTLAFVGYVIVIGQTLLAPKNIIALAYDSGGVTTSTVTVPLVAALGPN